MIGIANSRVRRIRQHPLHMRVCQVRQVPRQQVINFVMTGEAEVCGVRLRPFGQVQSLVKLVRQFGDFLYNVQSWHFG